MSVTHPFVSAKADGPDTTVVRPTNWNAGHTITDIPPDSDDARDLGSGALRWRDIYASNSVRVGTSVSSTGAVRLAYQTSVSSRNSTNASDESLIRYSTDIIELGAALSSAAKIYGTLVVAGASVTIGAAAGGKVIAAGTLTAGGLLGSAVQVATSGPLVYSGSGAPSISAAVKGSLYLRSDGVSNVTRAYIATDTAGTWTAINTVA